MIRTIVFAISFILCPLVSAAELDSSSLSVLPESLFRPETARVWHGPAEKHSFDPALAYTSPFPPFEWSNGDFSEGEVWYEFEVAAQEIPEELAGILITRVYLTADVYLNEALIGSGGTMAAPMAKNAHRPLYFSFPRSAWSQSSNKIRIHHKSYPDMGYIVDILVGSDAELRPLYEQREFQQQTIPKILFIVEILAALILFYIWFLDRNEKHYLLFAFSLVMISIFTLNQFLIDTIVPHKIWLVLNNTSIDWWAASLIVFVNRKLGVDTAPLRYALLSYSILVLLIYISSPLNRLPGATLFHAVSMLLVLMNTVYITIRADMKEALPYIAFFAAILLMALHDILMQSGIWEIRWLDGYFILFYAAPLACFLVFGKLIREFVGAMLASKEHAANLEMHIKLTKQELEEQYEKLNTIVENQAVEKERERIYRDLHDDVGAKLLSLFYRAKDSRLELLARSALEDLRDIVSRKTLNGEQLEIAVKQWEIEAGDRVRDQGISLRWKSVNVSGKHHLDERQFTHAKRMLREAISNAMRHNSACEKITIDVAVHADRLSIEVSNDGVVVDADQWQYGRGINNMRIRARELAGDFQISSEDSGSVSLIWSIPLANT